MQLLLTVFQVLPQDIPPSELLLLRRWNPFLLHYFSNMSLPFESYPKIRCRLLIFSYPRHIIYQEFLSHVSLLLLKLMLLHYSLLLSPHIDSDHFSLFSSVNALFKCSHNSPYPSLAGVTGLEIGLSIFSLIVPFLDITIILFPREIAS